MFLGSVKQNIITLAVSNLIIGLIEFIFNIYLSRVLGAEGMGLLSLITPINCLFLSFMTEGIVITMSKLSARRQHMNQLSEMNASITVSILASLAWAIFLVIFVCILAPVIAKCFLKDQSLVYPILATCPLMLLMSISNILKGHFLGLAKIKVPAAINISEKLLRFPVLYILIAFILNRTSFPSVTLVYICYSIGEIQSVILLGVYYKYVKPHVKKQELTKKMIWSILKSLTEGAFPICMTQCVFEIVNAFSVVIVKSRLCSTGFDTNQALALLGKYSGMVLPLMIYPMILIGAACSIVVPKISTFLGGNKPQIACRLIKRALVLSFCIGLIALILFWSLSDFMGNFFYRREDLGLMIKMAGICSPIFYMATTSSSLLIGAGFESQSFRNSLLQQLLLLIGLTIFTGIPALNIYGYFISIFLSDMVLLAKNLVFLSSKGYLFR